LLSEGCSHPSTMLSLLVCLSSMLCLSAMADAHNTNYAMNNNNDLTVNNNNDLTMNNNNGLTMNNNNGLTMNNNNDYTLNSNNGLTMNNSNDYTINSKDDYGMDYSDDVKESDDKESGGAIKNENEVGFPFTRPDRLNQLCSKTCRLKQRQTCTVTAADKCKTHCKVQPEFKRVLWHANLCGLRISKTVVPIITLTEWMHAIESLEFVTKVILCQSERYARTNPQKLIDYITTQLYTWCSRVRDCDNRPERFIVKTLVSRISSYLAMSIHEEGVNHFKNDFISKLHTWKLEAKRLSKLHHFKIDPLTKIFRGTSSAVDVFPLLREFSRVTYMPKLPRPAKIDMEKVLVDMQLTTLRERIAYILNTYDKQIDFNVKVKLAQLLVMEEDIYGHKIVPYREMKTKYEQIIKYLKNLIMQNILKGQAYSEMKTYLTNLGIGMNQPRVHKEEFMFNNGPVGVTQSQGIGITRPKLIEQLIAKKVSIFAVQRPQDCDISLCHRSIMDSVCLYGASCNVIMNGGQCTVKISNCKQKSGVKQLAIQDIIAQLRQFKVAQTITYTRPACMELSTIAGRAFPAGGFTLNAKWSHLTKICRLEIIGMRSGYPECGNGCKYNELQFLKAEEVAQKAARTGGAVFKVPDCLVCASYCNKDVAISRCGTSFSCTYKSECWGRECTCQVKHTCLNQINFRSSQKSDDSEKESDIEEETIEIPKVEPVVTEGKKVLKDKKEEAKEAKNRMALG